MKNHGSVHEIRMTKVKRAWIKTKTHWFIPFTPNNTPQYHKHPHNPYTTKFSPNIEAWQDPNTAHAPPLFHTSEAAGGDHTYTYWSKGALADSTHRCTFVCWDTICNRLDHRVRLGFRR